MGINTAVDKSDADQMKPGAQNNGAVQLATGSISFPIRLFSLVGRNSLNFDLIISYNSGGLHKIVDTWSLDAPTGLLGLGWSLSKEAIIRNATATAVSLNDVYYLFTGGHLYPLFKTASSAEGDSYECENYSFWKIRYLPSHELWTVTKENGDCYSYGGVGPASAAGFKSSVGDSIEWAVKWDNWTGPSNVAAGQEQFPLVWNLASIENSWSERITFEYEQTQRLIGTLTSPRRRPFTKSCRLRRVTGACGDAIVLQYNDKQPQEYQRPHTPPPTAQATCQLVGELSARGGWDPWGADPDPRLTLTVTSKNGFSRVFSKEAKSVSRLSFAFDLPPDAPDVFDIAFQAEDVDPVGGNDPMLSGVFTEVVANAGVRQASYKQYRRVATLKLGYVNTPLAADADVYQDRQETHYLANVELYNAVGVKIEQMELDYRLLGADAMQKRVLTRITHAIRTKEDRHQPHSPSHRFEYYGEAADDGVSGVSAGSLIYSNDDIGEFTTTRHDYRLFNAATGALFGALKSFTSPEGAKTSYRYQELRLEQARRELEIQRPQNDLATWLAPQTYFGSDYVVVIWKGSAAQEGLIYVTVYQWRGRWLTADLGALPNGANTALQVEVAADFFAIVTPKPAQSVRLFWRNPPRPEQWKTQTLDFTGGAEVTVTSGRHFLALFDKANAKLHRFTRDGGAWRAELPEMLGDGRSGAVLALTARDNFIVTASATPDNASLPELRLYSLDELRHWRVSSLRVAEHFFEKNGYQWDADINEGEHWSLTCHGIKALELHAGDTFMLLQAAADVARRTNLFGGEESFEVYRHFIYRWPGDYASLKLDLEPCLDISKGVIWDCIKRHNSELVIRRQGGLVRPSVIGDQIIIDAWEDITLLEKINGTPKQKKFVYQYSGGGWLERIFNNDQVLNNYIGWNSFSITENGQAQYWEFDPSAPGWRPSNMPTYKDGNASLFEKLVWPIISLVGGVVTLPLDFGPGLLIDILLLNLDVFITAMTKLGGAAQGAEQFFSANFTRSDLRQNNLAYRRDSEGQWLPIGDLTPEPDVYIAKKTGQMRSLQTVFENQKLDYRSTQYVENAILCTLELEQYGVEMYLPLTQRGHHTLPGFPHYKSKVHLLKNGVFFKAIALPEGELTRRGPNDPTLCAHHAFISFKGGASLQQASALKLYRVINDDIQGPLTDFVASQVTVSDGYSKTHTHYRYDTASASVAPTGAGALYGKVTTIYSGASPDVDQRNGFSESLFHVDHSALYQGLLYQTTLFDHAGVVVAAHTWRWQAFEHELLTSAAETPARSRKGYFVRAIATTSAIDGATRLTETDYCTEDALEFELTAGDKLPVMIPGLEIKEAAGWRIDGNARLAVTVRGGSSMGAEPWRPAISPLRLEGDLAGTLQFLYEVTTDIDARGQASLEAWAGDSKIWSDERAIIDGGFTQWAALSLAFDHGPVELRVACRLEGVDLNLKVAIYQISVRTAATGAPTEVRRRHYDAAGHPVHTVSTFHYGWQKYPALRAQNILTPVVETRTRLNDIVTAATATIWRPLEGDADGATGARQRWAPVATYRAKRSTGRFNFSAPERNPDWVADSTVLARTSQYGVATETQDIDGLVHSVLYDQRYRFPVAGFVHASVERGEAGYYGFEDYEASEPWRIDGARRQDAHTGAAALAGSPARLEPKRFTPRSEQTRYIVSAWLKPRSGGGGRIGFGDHGVTVAADSDGWRYVEFISAEPRAEQKPFASCDGAIDDFRFGPLDAPFDATVYDPAHDRVTAQLAGNGEALHMVYDHRQRPLATLGPDGQVLSLRSERYSREGETAFEPGQPNQALTILPRHGGRYYRDFAEFTGRLADHRRADQAASGSNKGLYFTLVAPTPASAGARSTFIIRLGAVAITGAITWEATGGGGLVLNWSGEPPASGSVIQEADDSAVPAAPGSPPADTGFNGRHPVPAHCTVLLLLLDGHAYGFIGGTLRASAAMPAAAGGALSLEWSPAGDAALADLVICYDPIVNLAFSDGLGRVIQTQRLADHGAEAIAAQTRYDGWGHAALQTKPAPVGPGLCYQRDLVSAFDWASGVMAGKVVDYYGRAEQRATDQQANDHLYPYARQATESSPLARAVEFGRPGVEFIPGAPHAVRRAFGWTAEATALLADLGLPQDVSRRYTALTTYHALDNARRTAVVQMFDLQGKPVARRQGAGAGAAIWSYSAQHAPDETTVITRPPKAFASDGAPAKDHYATVSVVNCQGLLKQASDSDRGVQHYIYDPAGRLRFKLDAAGAAERPNRILYWKYDALGRVLEDGFIHQNWDGEQLQQYADTDSSWPASSAKAATPDMLSVWKNRYLYDAAPSHTTAQSEPRHDRLEQLLAAAAQGDASKWGEADQETWKILIKSANREKEGHWLNAQDFTVDATVIGNISPSVLHKINQLWDRFSGGKYGFHIQQDIWRKCNASTEYNGRVSFGKRIGWYNQDRWIRPGEIQYNLSAPIGHLPASGVFHVLSYDDWSVALSGLNTLYARLRERQEDEESPPPLPYLQGRLSQTISCNEDGAEIEETYRYDRYGRLSAVGLRASAFDNAVRTTTYRYDVQGNVIEIGYPASRPGAAAIGAVHYAYTNGGRMASIGTADDPTFYAAYEYHIDGGVKTERLNRKRLQRDYRYDFQGRLTAIEDRDSSRQTVFAETLSYRDAGGGFKDGNIAQASFTGAAIELPHRYTYEYDEHGRLLSAQAAALTPQAALANAWSVAGIDGKPIGYDANGNILTIMQQGIAQERFYQAGTNRLAGTDQPRQARGFSFEPHELDRLHARPANHNEFEDHHWYCKDLGAGRGTQLTTQDKHSGAQSLQLRDHLLSRLQVTGRAARYVFTAWVKNPMPGGSHEALMSIGAAGGQPLVSRPIPFTQGEWRLFECTLEPKDLDAVTALEALLSSHGGPVFVDDVFFGIDPADYRYDANGCVIRNDRLSRLQYDPLTGLPREIQSESNSSDSQQTRLIKLQYSAHRQRILKTAVIQDVAGSAGERTATNTVQTTLYLHGSNAYPLCEERRVSRGTTWVSGASLSGAGVGYPDTRGSDAYVYGVGGLIAMHEGQRAYFFCKDHLGSVRVVVDQDSPVCAVFNYLPFGERIMNPNSLSASQRFRYLYTGQEYDWETGLYNYRARLYDPILAIFYSPDPLDQFFSPYLYVGNNPVNRIDPTGQSAAEFLRDFGKAMSRDWKPIAINIAAATALGAGSGAAGEAISRSKGKQPINWEVAIGAGAAGGFVGSVAGELFRAALTTTVMRSLRVSSRGNPLSESRLRLSAFGVGAATALVGSSVGLVTSLGITSQYTHKFDFGWGSLGGVAVGAITSGILAAVGAKSWSSGKFSVYDSTMHNNTYVVQHATRDDFSVAQMATRLYGGPVVVPFVERLGIPIGIGVALATEGVSVGFGQV